MVAASVGILIVLTLSSACGATQYRQTTEKSAGSAHYRWALAGGVTDGVLVGGASDLVEKNAGRSQDNVVYGADLEFLFRAYPKIVVGVVTEAMWKFEHQRGFTAIKATSYGVSALYSFRPIIRSSYFIRIESGSASGRRPSATSIGKDYDGGTHPYLRLGVGYSSWHSSRLATRIEFYYKRGFTKGYKPDTSWIDKIDFDVAWLGLSLDLSCSLF